MFLKIVDFKRVTESKQLPVWSILFSFLYYQQMVFHLSPVSTVKWTNRTIENFVQLDRSQFIQGQKWMTIMETGTAVSLRVSILDWADCWINWAFATYIFCSCFLVSNFLFLSSNKPFRLSSHSIKCNPKLTLVPAWRSEKEGMCFPWQQ